MYMIKQMPLTQLYVLLPIYLVAIIGHAVEDALCIGTGIRCFS